MADPYGYERPTLVDLGDNVNTFRRKVNQISDDLGDKRRLLTDAGTSLASDSDIVGNLIELDYRINETSGDLYLRANGGSLYIQNGNTSTIAAEFLYDSAAGTLSLVTPMSGDFTIDTVGDIILDADGNDIRFKNGGGGDEVVHTLANDANYTITAPADYLVDAVGDIDLDAGDLIIRFKANGTTHLTHTLGPTNFINSAQSLVRNISGALTDSASTSILRLSGTTTTDTVGTDYALTAGGNYTVDVDGSIADSAASISRTTTTTISDTSGTTYTVVAGTNISQTSTAGSTTHVSGTTTTHTVGTDYALTAGGNYTVDVDGAIADSAGTTISRTAGTNITDTASTGSYALNTGTTLEQTAGSSITQTSTTTFDQVSGGNFTTTVTGNALVDASGDITLSADGNDIVFDNGAGGDTVTHTLTDSGDYTVAQSGTGDYTVDVGGDIILDAAGDNIVFKDDGSTRITYTLGATTDIAMAGSLTTNVAGSITDSAGTTYAVVAGTSITQTAGTTFNQVSGGNFTTTVTGDVLVDASGTITLDADGNDVIFKNGAGGDTVTHTLADNADYTIIAPDDVVIDAVGNITLDADANNIFFRDGSVARVQYALGTSNVETWNGNLTRNVSAALVDSAGTSITTVSGTTTTHTVGTNYNLTAGGNSVVNITGSIDEDAGTTIDRTAGTNITDTASTGSYTLTADTNISQTATTGTITQTSGTTFTQTSGGAFTQTLGGNLTTNVTGNILIDASGQYNLSTDTTIKDSAGTAHTTVAGTQIVRTSGSSTTDTVGTDYTLTAENNINQTSTSGTITQTSGTTFDQVSGGNFTTTVTGDFTVDASGIIVLDTESDTITFKDGSAGHSVTHVFNPANGDYTVSAPRDYTLDIAGDIILDADGGDIFFKDAGTTNYQFATDGTISRTGDVALDVTGDITLDAAGDNIVFADAGSTRITYTLDATTDMALTGSLTHTIGGDYTENVTGSTVRNANAILDSSDTTYTVVAKTSVSQTSGTTFEQVSGTTFTQTSGGNFTTNVTGEYLVDASGDITLDADGGDIFFKDGGTTDYQFATNGTISRTGDITLDVTGDITLDADGGNWFFNDNTVTQFEFIAGTNKEIDVPSGDLTIDVAGDITLDADGGDILLKDGGTEFGRLSNSAGSLQIYSPQSDKDINFVGNDGGTTFTALSLDMSDSGSAIFNHDIYLPDNGIARFGNASDLTIYHTGSENIIEAQNGILVIRQNNDDNDVLIQSDNSIGGVTNYFRADGSTTAAILYFGGSEKISTTSTGINVTGTAVTDGLTVDGTGTAIDLRSNNNAGTALNTLRFTDTDPTAVNNAEIGKIEFYATDTSSVVASIVGHNGSASPDGYLQFNTAEGTALRTRMRIEDRGDISFYDSVGSSQQFFWDASTSRLGLGTTTPDNTFHVVSGAAGEVAQFTGAIEGRGLSIRSETNTDASAHVVFNSQSGGSKGMFTFETDGAERARLDENGNLLVGKTSSGIINEGVEFRPGGQIFGTQDGAYPLLLNRVTSDGDIAQFRKDNVTVGSIGVAISVPYFINPQTSGSGLRMGTGVIQPSDNAGAKSDANHDLGSSSGRFKDLYLSGRISAGGVSATGSNGIWIDSATGNVGIGTASPLSVIHLVDDTSTVYDATAYQSDLTIERKNTSGNNQSAHIRFNVTGHEGSTTGEASIGAVQTANASSADIVFTTRNAGTRGERMRITSAGNVGIKNSNPSSYSGDGADLVIGTTSGDNGLSIISGTSGTGNIYFGDVEETGTGSRRGQIVYDHASDHMRFATAASEAMRIDQNRNLLVSNTTTSTPGINNATTGHSLSSSGFAAHSRDGDVAALFVNVNGAPSSKGVLTSFRKQGVYIGEIGYDDSDLTIYSTTANHIGLRFGSGAVLPVNNAGTVTASIADLGGSTYKFKDLWISGTANLPTVDIDGGSIDGTTIGSTTTAAAFFTDVDITGTLTASLISPTTVSFNDYVSGTNSNILTFGNDSDLAIYHDGSHSYIKDKGTGDLRLTTNAFGVRNSTDTQNMITAAEGDAVTLYHNDTVRLATTSAGVTVSGLLTADTKSFTIDHPTKEGMKLRYGSLEGPEHGVYVRGRLNGENTIELPEVWLGLVDENTITVNLTPIGKGQCWVEDIQNNTVTVGGHLNCFYMVLAERKDVEKLEVEFPADGS